VTLKSETAALYYPKAAVYSKHDKMLPLTRLFFITAWQLLRYIIK
jgi:hypothetical protein